MKSQEINKYSSNDRVQEKVFESVTVCEIKIIVSKKKEISDSLALELLGNLLTLWPNLSLLSFMNFTVVFPWSNLAESYLVVWNYYYR